MSEIVAKCTNNSCRNLFNVPKMFSVFGGGSISFSSIGVDCPRCGAHATILEGTFKGDKLGNPIFESGPVETFEAVSSLRKIIADAKAGREAEEILIELEKKSVKLGAISRNIVARKGLVFLIAALSYILAACDAKIEMKLDWNTIADQIHVYATGKDPYPGLTAGAKPDSASLQEPPAKAQQSEPEQTSSLKQQMSHHKSTRSKRQRRRVMRHCAPKN